MIAAALLSSPAPAAPGTPGASSAADSAAGAFAVLLAGLVPMAIPVAVAPPQWSAASGSAGSPDLAAIPGPASTPTAPTIPTPPAAAPPPALPAGRAPLQSPAALPNGSGDELRPAAVPPAAGPAGGAAPPVPPPLTGNHAEPRLELPGRATATPLLGRLPATGNSAAAPAPVPIKHALAVPAEASPVASRAPAVAAGETPRPAGGAMDAAAATERAPAPPSNAIDAPSQPSVRGPAAVSPVALAGAEPLERAPAGDAMSEPAVELGEIAPARAERAASEPPGPSQRATPPPLVQVGVQIATAAARRVERMVVQLEPAALGRVEVRLDFSHDNRVSALIAADRPETLEVLQRDSRALERSLQEAGLRLADNALNFSLRQEHRERQGAAGEPSDGPLEPLVAPLAEDARAAPWFLAERVLDIRI